MQSINVTPGVPSKFRGCVPYAEQSVEVQPDKFITGVTRDSAGAVLGFCRVALFLTKGDVFMGETTSDGTGVYSFYSTPGATYYVVSYLTGSPDVFGTTVNTLSGEIAVPVAAPPAATLVDSYSESNFSGADELVDNDAVSNGAIGQTFTATAVNIGSVKFYLAKTGAPTGNATVKLYATTGTFGTTSTATGAALATSDNFDVSTLTGAFTLTTFTFSGANQVLMTNGTHYAILVTYSGGSSGNSVDVGVDSTAPTHAGNLCYHDGGGFGAVAGEDACFYVYST